MRGISGRKPRISETRKEWWRGFRLTTKCFCIPPFSSKVKKAFVIFLSAMIACSEYCPGRRIRSFVRFLSLGFRPLFFSCQETVTRICAPGFTKRNGASHGISDASIARKDGAGSGVILFVSHFLFQLSQKQALRWRSPVSLPAGERTCCHGG